MTALSNNYAGAVAASLSTVRASSFGFERLHKQLGSRAFGLPAAAHLTAALEQMNFPSLNLLRTHHYGLTAGALGLHWDFEVLGAAARTAMSRAHIDAFAAVTRSTVEASKTSTGANIILASAWSRLFDTDVVSRLVGSFDFRGLHAALQRYRRLPENWWDVEADVDDIADSVKTVLGEGIPLGYVPSARVTTLLLNSDSASARRRVIRNNARGILKDCEERLAALPAALSLADGVREAIATFRGGFQHASQALATNILDTLLHHHTRAALAVAPGSATNSSYRDKLRKGNWRLRLCVFPMSTWMGGNFAPEHPPKGFRRNATAHVYSRNHYTTSNAVVAIMAATSLLCCFVRDTDAFS